MKIRLYAFGNKLMGRELMDVPENSTPVWDMVLKQPLTVMSGYHGQKISEIPPFNTICRFEWTGKMEMETGARIYQLTDIAKH